MHGNFINSIKSLYDLRGILLFKNQFPNIFDSVVSIDDVGLIPCSKFLIRCLWLPFKCLCRTDSRWSSHKFLSIYLLGISCLLCSVLCTAVNHLTHPILYRPRPLRFIVCESLVSSAKKWKFLRWISAHNACLNLPFIVGLALLCTSTLKT